MNRRQPKPAAEEARKRAGALGEAGDSSAVEDLIALCRQAAPAVRRAHQADEVSPGQQVLPDVREGNHRENRAYGYHAYQDGGYWYYLSLGVAMALARKPSDLAREWVGNAYADRAGAEANPPYERSDGMKPENNRDNASGDPLMGMSMAAAVAAVKVESR